MKKYLWFEIFPEEQKTNAKGMAMPEKRKMKRDKKIKYEIEYNSEKVIVKEAASGYKIDLRKL